MDTFVIEGGNPLRGTIRVSGSKNAVLPIMAATLMTADITEIDNVPNLRDVQTMSKLLTHLGADVRFTHRRLFINTRKVRSWEAPYDLVRTMRASVLVMGALLGRFGKARVSLPGGCAIGARPIDLHLKHLSALGVEISLKDGYVHLQAKHAPKSTVRLAYPSVGATENLMMYAASLSRRTVIAGAAREPEIDDLAAFLTAAGAKITARRGHVEVSGADRLAGVQHRVIPDRIEAGTFAAAAALTRGDLHLAGARPDHLGAVLKKISDAGARVEEEPDGVRIVARNRPRSLTLTTMPYPGFPTDMQAQFMALTSVGDGTSVITETVFENRFMHAAELSRMGANIAIDGRVAVIKGVRDLKGAPVTVSDLRAGAALVLAGLAAKGRSVVHRVYHLDRGYESMEKKLKSVGASIARRRN
ncbi:UDP-N-acetylglucosamine 1-carboxyvinyltransferase [bacterium]|nr:UDP-N-acetylglucosamine 1-carboxyvinyltransferase [bacterium]